MSGRLAATIALSMLALGTASFLLGSRWVLSLPHPVPLETERYNPVFALVGMLAFSLVGALILSRRPAHPIGWVYAVAGPLLGLSAFTTAYAQYDAAVPGVLPAGAIVGFISGLSYFGGFFPPITIGLLLFPDGKLPSRRWRVVAALIVLVFLGFNAQGVMVVAGVQSIFGLSLDLSGTGPLNVGLGILLVAAVIGSVASLVQRWRTSSGELRQQIKWVGVAGLILAACLGVTIALGPSLGEWGFSLFTFGFSLIPIAAGIAILRYRLYDIDLIIKRTVVYGATSAAIAVTFFVGIVSLQPLLHQLTPGSEVSIAASTLLSFALFQPIRRRIQSVVDRRFDRHKYDAERTLDAFSTRLREEIDLDALHGDLVAAVGTTMAPAHVSLWLRESRP
jgi:hypothetical protein